MSSKLCLNLCSRKWLKPNRNLVRSFPPGIKMSWRSRNDVSLYVPAASQIKHPTESRWNVTKTSQWYISTTSYWDVVTNSQKDVTTTSHQYVSMTSQKSLKWNTKRRLSGTLASRFSGMYHVARRPISTSLRRLL